MRKVLISCMVLLLGSCLSESSVKPGVTNTFVRYFNGGNNDDAVAMEETPDKGFIILVGTKIQKAEADLPNYKIKMIKTDINGNPVWTKLFPDITDKINNYRPSNLQILPNGGYVVIGDDIQSDGSTKAMIFTVDDSGNQVKAASQIPLTDASGKPVSTNGKAVAINTAGNYLVLSTSGTDVMLLSEIDKTTFSPPLWSIPYSAGQTALANRLFIDEVGKVLWSGVATKNGLTGIRMIKTAPNTTFTDFDLLISQPTFSEVATDFCRFGLGYAITGSTNQKPGSTTPGADTDILFKQLSSSGQVLWTKSYPFSTDATDNQNDTGNSITSTNDGGLIILSSVNSAALKETGKDTDYYLIKIDAFGEQVWTSAFGSKYKDDGVTIRQTSDGGYAVLGTTTQGALKLVTLTKTDKNGAIQ